ncbi:MAG: hypothetical protein MK324_15920 [Pirellulales bacterium]|nr:hypothetical protein [Pirellulales bacterium]
MGNQNGKGTVEFWSLAEAAADDSVEVKGESTGCEGSEDVRVEEEKKPREIKPFHVVEVDKPVRGIDFTKDGRRFIVAWSDG